jgi:uncharacterized protein
MEERMSDQPRDEQPGTAEDAGSPPPPSGSGALPPPAAAPHPSGLSAESRNWAVGAHLSAFVGAWAFLAFVGPLVIWLIRRDYHDPFGDHHAKEALNFNLSMLVYLVAGTIIGFLVAIVTLGLGLLVLVPVGIAVAIGWVVLTIVAAVKANNGEGYRYPITIRFVS